MTEQGLSISLSTFFVCTVIPPFQVYCNNLHRFCFVHNIATLCEDTLGHALKDRCLPPLILLLAKEDLRNNGILFAYCLAGCLVLDFGVLFGVIV